MGHYKLRPDLIEAKKFEGAVNVPEIILWLAKRQVGSAAWVPQIEGSGRTIEEKLYVMWRERTITVRPGYWIILDPRNKHFVHVLADDTFCLGYEEVLGDPRYGDEQP